MTLTIDSLSKRYPNGVHALNAVSLKIGQGMFGLLGPNGAGKSTLMKTIATLQHADSGSVFLDEINVLKEKDSVRKVLGYLPQDFGVYPRISAEAMLMHIAALKGIESATERKESVHYLLEKVNLYKDRNRSLGSYSGGMKQRFGIAQALLGDPKLIIVDEPTAGLDPAERNRFYNLLSQIGKNTIVILSTHLVDDVMTLCSEFAIICKGEVLLKDRPVQAIDQVAGKIYTRSIDVDRLDSYKNEYQILSTQIKGGEFFIRVFSESAPPGFQASSATLEDVYFKTISSKVDIHIFF